MHILSLLVRASQIHFDGYVIIILILEFHNCDACVAIFLIFFHMHAVVSINAQSYWKMRFWNFTYITKSIWIKWWIPWSKLRTYFSSSSHGSPRIFIYFLVEIGFVFGVDLLHIMLAVSSWYNCADSHKEAPSSFFISSFDARNTLMLSIFFWRAMSTSSRVENLTYALWTSVLEGLVMSTTRSTNNSKKDERPIKLFHNTK